MCICSGYVLAYYVYLIHVSITLLIYINVVDNESPYTEESRPDWNANTSEIHIA